MTIKDLLSTVTVFDTETTDKDFKQAEIIEFASGRCSESADGTAWTTDVSLLFRPTVPISAHASAVNHITNRMVANSPAFSEYADAIQQLLNEGVANIAHNIFYDAQVLQAYGVTVPNQLCTMKMAKKLFNDDASIEAYNLSYLRYRFDLDIPENISVHRADGDVFVTGRLFEFLLKTAVERGELHDSPELVNDLMVWIAEPVLTNVMPFGKYKGQKLVDIPLSYWQWALQNLDSLQEDKPEFDPEFAASVINALDKIVDSI